MSLLPPLEHALHDAVARHAQQSASRPRRRRRVRLLVAAVGASVSVSAIALAADLLGDRTPAPKSETRLRVVGTDRTAALADYRGKILVVSFYASWCHPCREQGRTVDRVNTRLQAAGTGAAVLIGVHDTQRYMLRAMTADRLRLPVLADPGKTVSSRYGLTGVPETFILDRSGRIAFVQRGLATAAQLNAGIRRAADPSAPGPAAPLNPPHP